MTRTRILLALALVAAAVLVFGQRKASDPAERRALMERIFAEELSNPRIPRPRNGQCPVCGTMAQPYRMRTCPEDEICTPDRDSFNQVSRRVDCAHCNTTFRQ